MSRAIQLVIPMSGIGRRFIEAGYEDPKPLIEVDGKPIIEHVVNLFPGVEDIVFICNEKHIKETKMKTYCFKLYNSKKNKYLHAQIDAMPLYAKAGFKPTGLQFEEAGIQHFKMIFEL